MLARNRECDLTVIDERPVNRFSRGMVPNHGSKEFLTLLPLEPSALTSITMETI